jgi:glycosyltransferase involved in cell wall biosynthesis
MKSTKTLVMIVKDEEHIIRECLESMVPHIDRYDITDTGSTDKTKEIIKEFFEEKGIPGEVYDHEWDGFGKSRTQSLRNAEKGGADYGWVIDADDMMSGELVFPEDIELDAFSLRIKRGDFTWWRNQIFKLDGTWVYTGVLHEYAENPTKQTDGSIKQGRLGQEGYHVIARTMGGRNLNEDGTAVDPVVKYSKDAEMFLSCLTNPDDPNYEPENSRYMFYIAQSYFDSKQFEKASEWYMKRAEAGGWEEEVFYSLFRVAICSSITEEPWEKTCQYFLSAWNYRPVRAEPLYQIARIYRLSGHPRLGYLFAKQAHSIPFPNQDILFLANEVWEWQVLDEIGSCAFYAGQFQDGYDACMQLLNENKFPEEQRQRIMQNLEQYTLKIAEVQEQQKQQMAHNEKMNNQIENTRQTRLAAEKEEREAVVKKANAKKTKLQKQKKKRKQKA